jgi:hypothetical protein
LRLSRALPSLERGIKRTLARRCSVGDDRAWTHIETEAAVPHHWRPIKEKGGGSTRHDEVKRIVEDAGGELVFAEAEENSHPARWFALVDVQNVGDPDAMWDAIGVNGNAKKFP